MTRQKPGDETAPDSQQSGEAICPTCSGHGRVEGKACPACEGTGVITAIVGDA